MVGYGYGTGYKGAVCTLLLSKAGVKIGVAYGASLPDPQHLLTGSGKVHRFVEIKEDRDLQSAALSKLLKAARDAARARLKWAGALDPRADVTRSRAQRGAR